MFRYCVMKRPRRWPISSQSELCPQIMRPLEEGVPGQPNNAFDLWAGHAAGVLKRCGLVIFERRQLVDDHGIVVKRESAALDEPAQVLPVDDGDVRTERINAALPLSGACPRQRYRSCLAGAPHSFDFREASIAGHTEGRDHSVHDGVSKLLNRRSAMAVREMTVLPSPISSRTAATGWASM